MSSSALVLQIDDDVKTWAHLRFFRWDEHHRVWRPCEQDEADLSDEYIRLRELGALPYQDGRAPSESDE